MKCKSLLTSLVLTTTLILSGCHSYHAVNMERKPLGEGHYYLTNPPLYSGDKIKYRLKTGEEGVMTVATVSPNSINGTDNVTLPLEQLSSLEKQEISKSKTGAAVAGGVSATVVAIALVVVVSLSGAVMSALAA